MVAFLYPALFFLGGLGGSLIIFFYALLKKKQLHQTKLSIEALLRKAQEDVDRDRKFAQLELKSDIYKKRSDFELEMKRDKIELQRVQSKCQKKEDMLDNRETLLDDLRKELQQKERDLARKLDVVGVQEDKIKRLYDELVFKLEKLSGIKKDEAKRILFESLTKEVKLVNKN